MARITNARQQYVKLTLAGPTDAARLGTCFDLSESSDLEVIRHWAIPKLINILVLMDFDDYPKKLSILFLVFSVLSCNKGYCVRSKNLFLHFSLFLIP